MKSKGIFICLVLIAALLPSIVWGAIELKFCNYFPIPARQSKIGDEFIKDLEARCRGQLKITYFPAGTLLTAPKIYDGVFEGIADIGLSHIGYNFGRFRMTEALNLPLGFPNAWVANHVANDFYRQFKPKEWDKIHMLSMHAAPAQVVLSATKPVYKMEDLKGMTLRAMGFVAELVSALGATPRSIPIAEANGALQKRVIDLPSAEITRWKKGVEPVLDKYVKSMVAAGYQEKETRELINYARMRIEYWTKKQKESGVKSSTGPSEVRVK